MSIPMRKLCFMAINRSEYHRPLPLSTFISTFPTSLQASAELTAYRPSRPRALLDAFSCSSGACPVSDDIGIKRMDESLHFIYSGACAKKSVLALMRLRFNNQSVRTAVKWCTSLRVTVTDKGFWDWVKSSLVPEERHNIFFMRYNQSGQVEVLEEYEARIEAVFVELLISLFLTS